MKILQYVGGMNRAGAETLIMNIYRNIDKEKFEFHFISHTKEKCDYDDEIEKLGGKIIYIDRPKIKSILKYKEDFKELVEKNGPYDAVHAHMQLMNGLILKTAKGVGIKKRVCHAHLNGDYSKKSFFRNIYVNISKGLVQKNMTNAIACSNESGKYLYGDKEFLLLNNAIDLNQFKNSDKYKNYLNEEFDLDSNIKKITHIGRFVEAKNHKFIVEIFSKLVEKDNRYRLFLCGEGHLQKEVKEKVKELNIEKYVYFLGIREDINKILLSTDIFFMPSILEGLPVALIEAQAARCKCIISDNIPSDGDMELGLVNQISLEENHKVWIDKMLDENFEKVDFDIMKLKMEEKGYSLENNIKILEKLYSE